MSRRRSRRAARPRPARLLRNKGRYVVAALALYGAWQWLGGSDADSAGSLRSSLRTDALSSDAGVPCVGPPATLAAPAPEPPRELTGRLGLWVARVDPVTLRPVTAVARDADGLYPLASSYKQAVLWALLRDVDAGRVALTERFDVTLGDQSLGNYPFDGSDVRTLATRMIQNSDNTATDILHRRVGLNAVQGVADDLGLCRTRLILPTKHWWVAQTRLHEAWPGADVFASARGERRSALARALDERAQQVRADLLQLRLNEHFDGGGFDPALDLGTHNVSTPYEFGTLIAHEFLRPGLTPESRALQREVMATGFGRSQLRAPTTYFGGKGGNGWKILTMTGYVETPAGERVVYVFMQHESHEDYTIPNTRAAFRWINAAVQAVTDGP